MNKKIHPQEKPKIIESNKLDPFLFANTIAGDKSEKKDAEIIIPADSPNIEFNKSFLTDLKKKTILAPKEVIKKVNIPEKKAKRTGLQLIIISNIKKSPL